MSLSFLTFLILLTFSLSHSQHCVSDVQEIDKEGLVWPAPSFVPPWVLYPASKIYKSTCLENYLINMFQNPLNELTNVTFQMILDTYTSNKCPFYIHGGLLRDVLYGDPAHDVDIAFPCDPKLALQICKSILEPVEIKHNVSLCYINEGGYLFIGRRKIDTGIEGKYWEDSFFHLENQEYTPNMLYFDQINQVILDLNYGVEDIAAHQIRIPVNPRLRQLWLETANKSIGLLETPMYQKWLILKKVTRYWKLRAKGYKDHPFSGDKQFLISKIDELWNSLNYPMSYAFRVFICEALGGRFNNQAYNCYIPGGYRNITEDKISFCRNYLHELYIDIGQLQGGKIFAEINNMVAYTKCHNYQENYRATNFGERIELNFLIMMLIGIISLIYY